MKTLLFAALPLALFAAAAGCTTSEEVPAPLAAAMPDDYPDAATADPDHYSIEFENDIVRVLRISYGPGEESVDHAHPAGCGITLEPGEFAFTLPSGQVQTSATIPGTVNCTDAEVHNPRNVGDSEGNFVFLDLKDRATFDNYTDAQIQDGEVSSDGIPDAVAGDPAHYFVEYENDIVRILRARYAPGASSVLHSHPASCAIYLTGGTFRFTSDTGEVDTLERERGQVNCREASVHLPENIGTVEEDIIVMEMKGRDFLVE